jgi:hypothetical protein
MVSEKGDRQEKETDEEKALIESCHHVDAHYLTKNTLVVSNDNYCMWSCCGPEIVFIFCFQKCISLK